MSECPVCCCRLTVDLVCPHCGYQACDYKPHVRQALVNGHPERLAPEWFEELAEHGGES